MIFTKLDIKSCTTKFIANIANIANYCEFRIDGK